MVIGASGSGKTRLARRLADHYLLPFRPTDGVFWEPGWRTAAPERIDAWLGEVLDTPAWVLDGNFDSWRTAAWSKADLIVWLNLPRWLVVWQVTARNIAWWATRRSEWIGEPMTLVGALNGIGYAARS